MCSERRSVLDRYIGGKLTKTGAWTSTGADGAIASVALLEAVAYAPAPGIGIPPLRRRRIAGVGMPWDACRLLDQFGIGDLAIYLSSPDFRAATAKRAHLQHLLPYPSALGSATFNIGPISPHESGLE